MTPCTRSSISGTCARVWSFTSTPAEKARSPAPLISTSSTPSSWSTSSRTRRSSRSNVRLSTFKGGRSMTTDATPAVFSRRIPAIVRTSGTSGYLPSFDFARLRLATLRTNGTYRSATPRYAQDERNISLGYASLRLLRSTETEHIARLRLATPVLSSVEGLRTNGIGTCSVRPERSEAQPSEVEGRHDSGYDFLELEHQRLDGDRYGA